MFGARYLVRAGRGEVTEGTASARAPWCSNFQSYEAALACYRSPEYQAAERRCGEARLEADLARASRVTTDK